MSINLLFLILVGSVVGALSGYLGSFMVVKRMSLVGDALSHVALPGMALAIAFGVNPMLGAFVALCIAILGIWYLGEKSEIYPEALVGIFFTFSLAIGVLIMPDHEVFEALFGELDSVTMVDGLIIIVSGVIMFVITKLISKNLLLGIVSEDLAKASGVNVSRLNLVYLLLVGAIVALGIKFLGTLLTGALVIIPAVTAKNLAGSINQFQVLSIGFGVVSAVVGILVTSLFGITSGPAIVLVSIVFFVISYLIKVFSGK